MRPMSAQGDATPTAHKSTPSNQVTLTGSGVEIL